MRRSNRCRIFSSRFNFSYRSKSTSTHKIKVCADNLSSTWWNLDCPGELCRISNFNVSTNFSIDEQPDNRLNPLSFCGSRWENDLAVRNCVVCSAWWGNSLFYPLGKVSQSL